MEPVALLTKEHHLIERMITLLRREHGRLSKDNRANARFIDYAVDFIRTYADRCHHGKEEGILFRKLTEKQLSQEHMTIMGGLVKAHAHARKLTAGLAEANARYLEGDEKALFEIKIKLEELIAFYPPHMSKEDNEFFPASMQYLDEQEKSQMLDRFAEFDRTLIHEAYGELVERCEKE